MMEDPNKLEIEETLKKQFSIGICCVIWIWAIAIGIPVASFIQPVENVDPNLRIIISIGLCIAAAIISLLLIFRIFLGATKQRRFIITKDYIEFDAPTREILRISWAEIEKISINRIYQYFNLRRVFFRITFEGNINKSYILESGRECSNKTLKEILSTLEDYTKLLNKDFSFTR
ncbi:MAG: hypothetical protein ACFFBP_02750 [Promethearchaeota archaeon]